MDENSPIVVDHDAGLTMWAAYAAAHPEATAGHEDPPIEHFGDSPAMADELLAFVIDGPKRATAGLVSEYAEDADPLPRIGSHWVACDGTGRPRAILRTVELRVGPVLSVDDAFAWDEGEHERTRERWLRDHLAVWRRRAAEAGREFDEDGEVLFERFRVVWPPEVADGHDEDQPARS